jgi:predicted DNA binding CopG/RHH family protein
LANAIKHPPAPVPPADTTEDEVAKWFAENDMSEYDFEEVKDWRPPAVEGQRGLTTVSLRLPGWEIEELRRRAERLGVGYTTYIRLLVNRHLFEEKPIG